jgi:hypothetical protein
VSKANISENLRYSIRREFKRFSLSKILKSKEISLYKIMKNFVIWSEHYDFCGKLKILSSRIKLGVNDIGLIQE